MSTPSATLLVWKTAKPRATVSISLRWLWRSYCKVDVTETYSSQDLTVWCLSHSQDLVTREWSPGDRSVIPAPTEAPARDIGSVTLQGRAFGGQIMSASGSICAENLPNSIELVLNQRATILQLKQCSSETELIPL